MKFIWSDLQTIGIGNIVLTLILITIVYAALVAVFSRVIKRKFCYIFLSVSYVLVVVSYLLDCMAALVVLSTVSAGVLSIMAFANIGDFRYYIANPFKRKNGKTVKRSVEKIFDRHATYSIIESAVKALSSAKIGAIMTFERNQSLSEFCKNGVAVNAPITKELLITIFYPGTRLHDGAVIIHGDMITSAAVFYTPSTKAFTAKFGSRHRAAIGISEVSDSVTVVISEETGRISIAVNGQIESVSEANFLRVFENYMLDSNNER